MSTWINPKIILNKPIKNKCLCYYITLDKKETDKLVIKAKNYTGRGKGYAGTISKHGYWSLKEEHKQQLLPLLSKKEVKSKIEMILDLIYGPKRDKICILNSEKLVKFNSSLA